MSDILKNGVDAIKYAIKELIPRQRKKRLLLGLEKQCMSLNI
jgi:hypothetical protein